MDQIPLNDNPPAIRSGKNAAAIVVSAVVAALVVGGAVYAFQKKESDKAQDDLQSQINTLTSELAAAKKDASTPTPSATSVASPSPQATPDTPGQGWVRKTIPELNIAFDYPEKVGAFEYRIAGFDNKEDGTGTTMTASVGPKPDANISFYAQSKDWTTTLGRGTGFLDLDGYEKSGSTFNIYMNNWVTGKKESSFPATNSYSNPREVSTKSFTALVVDGNDMDIPQGLGVGMMGAIIPVGPISDYHAITVRKTASSMTSDEFTSMIKSFRSTK